MIRVAVIGAGAMGRNHARVLQSMSGVEVAAIVDPDLARARELARLHGGRPLSDVASLLAAGPPDAAIVAVPTQAHHATALELLGAGVHLLVEKPIAADLDEARALGAAAAASGRVLMVGHVERFNPAVVALAGRLRAGELGRVFQVRTLRVGPFPARIRDVGVAIDLATHDLDAMCFLTGSRAVRVYAESRREVHTSREDLVSALVRFEDDTVGTLEVNWLTPTKRRELVVTGERGMFHVDYLTQDLTFYENAQALPATFPALSVLRGVSEGSMTRFAIPKVEPLRAELDAFLRAVAGDASRIVSADDGARALGLAQALVDSATRREVVAC